MGNAVLDVNYTSRHNLDSHLLLIETSESPEYEKVDLKPLLHYHWPGPDKRVAMAESGRLSADGYVCWWDMDYIRRHLLRCNLCSKETL